MIFLAFFIGEVSDNGVEKVNNKRISDVVDDVCYRVYPCTLSVNNEMINKEVISTSPIKKARKIIIDRLIYGEDCSSSISFVSK